MQNWEYRCIHAPHTRTRDATIGGERARPIPQIENIMNAMGQDKWELVGVLDALAHLGDRGAILFFKRPKP